MVQVLALGQGGGVWGHMVLIEFQQGEVVLIHPPGDAFHVGGGQLFLGHIALEVLQQPDRLLLAQVGLLGVSLQSRQHYHPQPRHARHHHIQDHQVHLRAKYLQGPGPVFRLQDMVSLPRQQNAYAIPDVRVVFHQQNGLCTHGSILLFTIVSIKVYQPILVFSVKDFLGILKTDPKGPAFPLSGKDRACFYRARGHTVPAAPSRRRVTGPGSG